MAEVGARPPAPAIRHFASRRARWPGRSCPGSRPPVRFGPHAARVMDDPRPDEPSPTRGGRMDARLRNGSAARIAPILPVPPSLEGLSVALVHDWLTGLRGGEKCLEVLCRA